MTTIKYIVYAIIMIFELIVMFRYVFPAIVQKIVKFADEVKKNEKR